MSSLEEDHNEPELTLDITTTSCDFKALNEEKQGEDAKKIGGSRQEEKGQRHHCKMSVNISFSSQTRSREATCKVRTCSLHHIFQCP